MTALEEVISRAMSRFEQKLAEAMEDPDTEATQEQREALRTMLTEAFAENVRHGLVKTFGKVSPNIAPQAAADLQQEAAITQAEVERMQSQLEVVARKRARNPEKASKLLDLVLSCNRDTLKMLHTDVTIPEVKIPGADLRLEEMQKEGLMTARDVLPECKEQISESLEKSERFLTAFRILESNSRTEQDMKSEEKDFNK